MKITVRQLNEALMSVNKCSKEHENKDMKFSLNRLIKECMNKKISSLKFPEDSDAAILINQLSQSYKDFLLLSNKRNS